MTDNKNIGLKMEIRRAFLPEKAAVLDLACGYGEMYRRAYKNKVDYYLGIDNKKIHDTNCCIIDDNLSYIKKHSIADSNTFDLDSYGSSWSLLFLVLSKACQNEITVFVTDGLPLSLKRANKASKFVSATEMIPHNMKIPFIARFYPEIFNTMLRYVCQKYNWQAITAKYVYNTDATVCYWVLKLVKLEVRDLFENISDLSSNG